MSVKRWTCSPPWPTTSTPPANAPPAWPTRSPPALPGAVHDLTAARTHGLIDVLTEHEATTFADKAYQGAGGTVRTPFKRHATRPRLSHGQKAVTRAQARIRALGERAVSLLKGWKVLTKLRCRPRRATAVIAAIPVLHHIETRRQPR